MKQLLAAIMLGILAGCTVQGDSPDYITYFLKDKYAGHPISEFNANYGYPVAMFRQPDGAKMYRWVSTQYHGKPTQAAPTDYTSYGGTYQSVDTYHGYIERQYCEVRIYTDASDIIRTFAIAVDSTGKFSTSRCSEIFD